MPRRRRRSPPSPPPTPRWKPKSATLEAKVDKLETAQLQAQSQAQSQADVSAAVRNVLHDADQHSQFLSSVEPLSSGYDPSTGFVIRSEDGLYSMHPGLVLDFRNMTSYREKIPAGGGGETAKTGYDTQNGFDVTRSV